MTRIIYALVLCVLLAPAWASVPSSISFQGYLTDRAGSPEDGTTLVTFSIYSVEIGGSPQWSDTLNVVIESGLLSVDLGRPANPFPLDLFETPLWLGITVETDNEMIPRRALTSVGFSFKSEDANSVQGKSAADLDQSLHVDDLANPHAVTAAQAGAADQATLNAHATDTGNPHQVTSAQTGGTDAGVFSKHESGQSAHHVRYGDSEAVSAMGTQESGNPLNHTRYNNSESVTAVLAADGTGSGFDADTVDGIDGSSLQNQVQDNTAGVATNRQNRGISVTADGQVIGRFVSPTDGWLSGFQGIRWLPVLSDAGRLFFLDTELATEGQLRTHSVYFNGLNCTGLRYLQTGDGAGEFAMRNGYIFRSVLDDVLQVERNAESAPAAIASVLLDANGQCQTDDTSNPVYPVIPNDPIVTGVPDGSFTPPIRIQ